MGLSAVLLAAGESARMGSPKALLPWDGRPLITYQVRSLLEAGVSEVVVVLGHRAPEVAPHIRGTETIKVLINPLWGQGKTTSVKAGLREVDRRAEGVLLLAVDQPRPVPLLSRLISAHRGARAPLTQPVYQGKRGHPIIFDRSLLPDLLAITEEGQGVREVVNKYRDRACLVPVEEPIVLLDINTEEDYRRARSLLGLPG